MPEKPEVITVCNKLKNKLLGKQINDVKVLYRNIIDYDDIDGFIEKLKKEVINDITTRGKWIVFHLNNYLLLAHLRMEGKFFFRKKGDPLNKHEHVIIVFSDDVELRFADVRKFARMMLFDKNNYLDKKPFNELGLEVWDNNLTSNYLKDKFKNKSIPIKSSLLDQSIITGIGNIYADEILFKSSVSPLRKSNSLGNEELDKIIKSSIEILDKAIIEGGTTIRSYTSEEGVKGNFQNNLFVHMRENEDCLVCKGKIKRIKIGGRSTYFCPNCQK